MADMQRWNERSIIYYDDQSDGKFVFIGPVFSECRYMAVKPGQWRWYAALEKNETWWSDGPWMCGASLKNRISSVWAFGCRMVADIVRHGRLRSVEVVWTFRTKITQWWVHKLRSGGPGTRRVEDMRWMHQTIPARLQPQGRVGIGHRTGLSSGVKLENHPTCANMENGH